jgi:hypothetical protein
MTQSKPHAQWAQEKRPHFYTQTQTSHPDDLNEQLENLLLTQQLGRITDMPRWYEGRHVWNLS